MADNVIIYDNSKGAYWGENSCGYATRHLAGIYTLVEANRIALGCIGDRQLDFHSVPDDHIPTLKARVATLERENAALREFRDEIEELFPGEAS